METWGHLIGTTQCTDRVTIDYQIEKNKKNGLIIVLMDFICYKDVFYL